MESSNTAAAAPDRLIRRPEVESLVGLSRTAIYRAEAAGRFPARRRIGRRAVAWSQAEVLAWMAARQEVRS